MYPNDKAKKALEEGLAIAKKNAEVDTGGWCHSFEMWKKDGYNKRGGARAMGMITGIAYGGLLEMKDAVGVDPAELLPQTQKALKGMSDGGGGFTYGYDNGMGDLAMSRACYVLMGLQATGNYSHPFYRKITKSLKMRYKNCYRGHAFAPLHYFSVASAMHRQGKGEYQKFINHYLDWLMERQKESGEVPMQSDSGKRRDCR